LIQVPNSKFAAEPTPPWTRSIRSVIFYRLRKTVTAVQV
jgi:hypothetical protein